MEERIRKIRKNIDLLQKKDNQNTEFGANTHKYLSTKTEIERINLFEQKYNCSLPIEFKEFLIRIGYGVGPAYGIFSIDKIESVLDGWRDYWKIDVQPGNNAFLNNERIQEYNRDRSENKFAIVVTKDVNGILPISDSGCSYCSVIVLNGDQEGYIWSMDQGIPAGFLPTNMKFLDWYEKWLSM